MLGDFLVPMMIGAKDLAFPRINLLSWYLYIIGGVMMLHCMLTGGVDTGWTFYAPFSTNFSNTKIVEAGLAIFVAGFSSILTGLNFVVTIHRMRAPGMTWSRLPLFIWAHYATSIIQLLGTPVIAVTIVLVAAERALHLGIFDPKLGGDPLLFQHLFWFYSHPAVYIMILPVDGRCHRDHCLLLAQAHLRLQLRRVLVDCDRRLWLPRMGAPHVCRRNVSLRRAGFFLAELCRRRSFRHQGLSTGRPLSTKAPSTTMRPCSTPSASSDSSPSAASPDFSWPRSASTSTSPTPTSSWPTSTTSWSEARSWVIFGGMHFWWPKISGKLYPEGWARLAALIVFIGFNLTFFPQFLLGYMGMPRRYYDYSHMPEFQILNVLSTAGATVLGVGYLLPMVYFLWSMRYGKPASDNPWNAAGLEWKTPSPPPTFNFDEEPVVTWEAYNYEELDSPDKDAHNKEVPVAR